jgi:hypothetical protein
MMAVQPIVEADAPAFAHGRNSRQTDSGAQGEKCKRQGRGHECASNYPPHDTPDECASFLAEVSRNASLRAGGR